MRADLEHLQVRLTSLSSSLIARARRVPLAALAFDAWAAYGADQMPTLAAALSYYTLLALFPLLLLLISLSAPFIAGPQAVETAIRFARNYVPTAGDDLRQVLNQVLEARGPAGIIGIVGLLWSGAGLFDAIQIGMNRAWNIKHARPFWKQRLLSFTMIAVLGFVFGLSLAVSALTQAEGLSQLFGGELIRIVGLVFSIVLNLILFGAIYIILPNRHVTWREVWGGALIVAILWELAKLAFVWYLKNFARFSLVYGSVGSVIALLTWGYFTAVLLLFGAELCAVNARRQT